MSLLIPHPLLFVYVSSLENRNEETFDFNWMTYNSGNEIIFFHVVSCVYLFFA